MLFILLFFLLITWLWRFLFYSFFCSCWCCCSCFNYCTYYHPFGIVPVLNSFSSVTIGLLSLFLLPLFRIFLMCLVGLGISLCSFLQKVSKIYLPTNQKVDQKPSRFFLYSNPLVFKVPPAIFNARRANGPATCTLPPTLPKLGIMLFVPGGRGLDGMRKLS